MAIIDACRENPFEASTGRSIGGTRGLGRITAPEGTFVVFSAGAGQLALDRLSDDDADPNSVFTRVLLPKLAEPDLELRDLVGSMRREVRDLALSIGHSQFPAYYDELLGEFYMVPAAVQQVIPAPAPAPAEAVLRRDFEFARSIGTKEALEAFLERHADKDDLAVDLAREMLAALAKEKAGGAPAPTPEPQMDARAVMRASQEELNRLGCSAGSPDGIAGPRTRAAFEQFIREGDTGDLTAADLGSERALAALRAAYGQVCAETVAAPAPETTARAAGPTMAGTWRYRANCALVMNVNGSIRLSGTGGRYTGPVADSLGNKGTTRVTLSGNAISGTTSWSTTGTTENWVATLSADGQSYRGRSLSVPCTFSARLD